MSDLTKHVIYTGRTPVISVIIPAYNTAEYISECLDSVLAQTFADWEAICIDDGSTDESLSIFEQYAAKDYRIKVIHQENLGVCAARNNAIAKARGKYIFPLDSDDKIAPNCLAALYRVITTTRNVAVCPLGMFFYEDGRLPIPIDMHEPTKENMYSWRNGLHNSTMYPKKFWEKYGGYDETFRNLGAEDFDFYLNFIDDNQPVTQLKGELFYYRQKTKTKSRNQMVLSTVYDQTREAMFAKRPLMRLLHEKACKYNSTTKIFGVIPIVKIKREPQKTIVKLFNSIPVWQIIYKSNKAAHYLFGLFLLFTKTDKKTPYTN